MNSLSILKISSLFLTALLLLPSAPAEAQRTGDHIVPAIETVCDGDPFNFGLCNAYCEALDCDSDTPLGTPKACSNLLRNYTKHSGGVLPPCEQSCPCEFDLEGDFASLVVLGNEEFGEPDIDVEGTYEEFCDSWGPNGENTFVASALHFPRTQFDDPEGILLAYWVEDKTDAAPASCNELGVGFDGIDDMGLDGSYEFFDRRTSLTGSEAVICRSVVAKLCPD